MRALENFVAILPGKRFAAVEHAVSPVLGCGIVVHQVEVQYKKEKKLRGAQESRLEKKS